MQCLPFALRVLSSSVSGNGLGALIAVMVLFEFRITCDMEWTDSVCDHKSWAPNFGVHLHAYRE